MRSWLFAAFFLVSVNAAGTCEKVMAQGKGFSKMQLSLSTGANLFIEPARPADAKEVVAYLNKVGGESDFLTFGKDEFAMTEQDEAKFLEKSDGTGRQLVLKAVIDEQIVGIATMLPFSNYFRLSHISILGISVSQDHWRLGIGKALSSAGMEWARKAGFRKINLNVAETNSSAISLYESLGFKTEGITTRGMLVNGEFVGVRQMGLEY